MGITDFRPLTNLTSLNQSTKNLSQVILLVTATPKPNLVQICPRGVASGRIGEI